MKKFKFFLPILAFALASTGVFVLSSFEEGTSEKTEDTLLERVAWFDNGVSIECVSCEKLVEEDCQPYNTGQICECDSGVSARENPNHSTEEYQCDLLQKPQP